MMVEALHRATRQRAKHAQRPAMITPIIITEVRERAVQGMTRPFLCAAGTTEYFVKGAYAGMNSLCCEWVANRLAGLIELELPLSIPDFRMGMVPGGLIVAGGRADIADLGEGYVFASQRVHDVREPTMLRVETMTEEVMAQLLMLDLWLQNEDRSLSAFGGNPNLLVSRVPAQADDSGAERLWAYDFNLAFDPDFNRGRFFDAHVFGTLLRRWPDGFRERMEPKLKAASAEVRAIFTELPREWLHLDGDDSLPVQLDVERVFSAVELPFSDPDTFWKLP